MLVRTRVFLLLLVVTVLEVCVIVGSNPFLGNKIGQQQPKDSAQDADDGKQCFCELSGSINDCSCTVDTVDYFNNNKIYPRLRSLLLKDYFRFYRVNLRKPCPFWEDTSKCAMRFCSVSPCADGDVPRGLLHDEDQTKSEDVKVEELAEEMSGELEVEEMKEAESDEVEPFRKYLVDSPSISAISSSSSASASADNCHQTNRDHNVELSFLNTSITETAAEGFERWADHDELADNFCILDDHEDRAEYVDLLLNPERYTGYRGESAHRIWRTIYQENCFSPSATGAGSSGTGSGSSASGSGSGSASGVGPFVLHSTYAHMCMEQRTFYRLLSGLHTSINVHLSAKYLRSDPSDFVTPSGVWGRNLDEFKRRFSAATTGGEGLHWLQNLYFVYLVEMRALAKAAEYLRNERYYTGEVEEDAEVRSAVGDLLQVIGTFPTHFNESAMFAGGDFESLQLKSVFRDKFRNISKIMDCVGCDKCRLWGKLQVQGLGTALKILFSGKFEVANGAAERQRTAAGQDGRQGEEQAGSDQHNRRQHDPDPHFRLRRSEIVSLFNAFGRLSNSINELEEFRKVIR